MSFGAGFVSTGMKLYYYPRSRYSQKVLLALYEKQIAFTPIVLYPGDPAERAKLSEITPLGKVPVLVLDNGWKIPESSIIVEYLDGHGTGPRLIPEDRDLARQTRFHDRIADLYVTESYGTILRDKDPERVAAAHARLDALFTGVDRHLANRPWVMGDTFTLADCSLIPTLAEHAVHPFDRFANLTAYYERALARPSVARVFRELAAFVAKAAS
jgi:glutathione S-transferase